MRLSGGNKDYLLTFILPDWHACLFRRLPVWLILFMCASMSVFVSACVCPSVCIFLPVCLSICPALHLFLSHPLLPSHHSHSCGSWFRREHTNVTTPYLHPTALLRRDWLPASKQPLRSRDPVAQAFWPTNHVAQYKFGTRAAAAYFITKTCSQAGDKTRDRANHWSRRPQPVIIRLRMPWVCSQDAAWEKWQTCRC